MAKQRMVNTRFWDDDYVMELCPAGKLLFLYAITNTLTDLCGAYQITMKRIVFDTGLKPAKVTELLDKFEADGKMAYRDGWLVVQNFGKHQSANPKVTKGIERSLSSCPDWVKDRLSIGYQRLSPETAPKPKPEPELKPKPEPTDTHDVCDAWSWPMSELIAAFPDYLPDRITPSMIGFIEAAVKPGDEAAWAATLDHYRMNFDPALKRYLPDKTANLLGVFRSKKSELEERRNGTDQKHNGRGKRTDADVFAESANFYARYDEPPVAG